MSPNSDSILSQELSRRTALKALFGAASAAVLFGLPARADAAEASKETTDKPVSYTHLSPPVRWARGEPFFVLGLSVGLFVSNCNR